MDSVSHPRDRARLAIRLHLLPSAVRLQPFGLGGCCVRNVTAPMTGPAEPWARYRTGPSGGSSGRCRVRCPTSRLSGSRGHKYTIRLKANAVLQGHIAHLLKRPVGRRPSMSAVLRQLQLSGQILEPERRVVAKVEWHPGELYRVGFIVTTPARPPRGRLQTAGTRAVIKGKNAVNGPLSCRTMNQRVGSLQPGLNRLSCTLPAR